MFFLCVDIVFPWVACLVVCGVGEGYYEGNEIVVGEEGREEFAILWCDSGVNVDSV